MHSVWGQGLLLPLLVVMLPLVAAQSCPFGWMTWRSWCYYFELGKVTYMWQDAQGRCEVFDGSAMLYLESAEEKTWVVQKMKEFELINENKVGWWLGLTNKDAGRWQWNNGSPANASLLPWAPGQPGGEASACAYAKDGEFVADRCDRWKRIVCKRSKDVPVRCESDKGWLSMNGSCYKAFNARKTWQEASDACQMEEATLVTIRSSETNGFVWDLAAVEVGDLWIGLHIVGTEDGMKWQWQTGEPMEKKESYFVTGKPGSEEAWTNKRCVMMKSKARRLYSWTTENCQTQLSFVCQKPQGRCPDGWLTHQAKCYKFYSKMASPWNNAEHFCRQRGGTLMKITSKSEQTFLNAYLGQLAAEGIGRVWLGITDYSHDNQPLTWSDGSAILSYTNWAQGFPTNVKERQDCAYISTDSKEGLWVTSDCGQHLSFACMLPVNKDLILPPGVTTPVPYSCGEGGKQLGSQCYYVNETEATWLGAKAACQERAGTLARLDSEEAQTFVNSLLDSDNYWIGLNDRNKEGDYQWLPTRDGTVKNSTFWAPGMPKNGSLENCVFAQGGLDLQHKGQWSTERCNASHFFICQAPAQQDNDTDADGSAERPWGLKCGPFWEDNPNSDYCYLMSSEMLTWQDARDTCLHHGGDLASITSLEEQYFISGLMVNPQTLGAWIGANDLSLEAGWGWIDDSPFAFVNWASGEPNNIGREQDCAAISTGSARWYDLECSLRNGYVCKKRGNVPTTTEKTTVATTVPPGYSVGCPGGWLEYRGICYWMVRDKLSWLEARDQCFKMAAALATVRDNDHNNFLLSQVPKASCEDVHSNATQCSVWARQGECQVNPIWMSKNCHAACGLCRHVCRDRHTAASCKLWATVGECHRNPDWMHVWCAQSCGVCNEGLSDAVWIGLNSLRVSQSFEWVNGDDVTFTNWILNEPDDNQDSPTCVKMYTGTGRWSDEECATTTAAGYVCEAPVMQMKETSEPPIRQGCNQTGLGYNHLCYTLVESPAAWEDALADCQSRGGTLASVPDRFVQAFLAAELSVDTKLYWLGLADTDNPGTYSWTSGLPLQYTAWAQSHNGTELNTCVAMQTSRPVGLWINANCGQALAYICETIREGGFTAPTFPPTTLATTPDPGSPSLCQGGWKQFGPMCYTAVSDRQLTWRQASESCAEMAASLISVHDSSLSVFLQDNFNLSSSQNYWIGLNDIGRESVYEWQDGSAFGYSAWSSGEPNDLSHRENCVEFIPATARWNDAKCSSVRHYFCARPTGIQPASTTTTAPPDFGNATCDKEGRWALFDGLCYSTTADADNSVWMWSMAKYWCFTNGGTLASIHSRRQNDFLVSLVQDHPETQFWLGYNNAPRMYKVDADITWTDGSVLDFVSWGKNEGWEWRSSSVCIVLNKNTGLWGADDCSEVAHGFICQKEPPGAPTLTPPRRFPKFTVGGCPHNLTVMGSKCIAMKEVQHSLSWTRAALLCSSLYTSGRLLTLENPDEYDLLLSVMQNQTKNVWLGMKTVSSERFTWLSDKQMPLTYTKWAMGHPRKVGSLERCVAMTPSLTWIDMDCDEQALPICQVDRDLSLKPSFPVESDPAYPNYTQFGTRFFRLHKSSKTFSDARAVCQAEGADMASVRSAEEDSFIQRLAFDFLRPIWLGARGTDSSLRWVNGDPVTYQRSLFKDAVSEITIGCLTQNQRQWSLQDCLHPHPFVCVLDPAQGSAAATSTAAPGACPQGMVQHGSTCYLLDQSMPRTWVGAKMECKRRGLTLAVFHQSQQLHDLIDSGKLYPRRLYGFGDYEVWIGLAQMSAGGWHWADGEDLQYSHWVEDSTYTQSDLQRCGEMDLMDGRWRARPCFLSRPFLCQTDSNPPATSPVTALTSTSPAESTTNVITPVTKAAPTTEELATTFGADNSSHANTTYWPGGVPFHPAVETHPSISKKKAEPLSAGQIVGIIIGFFGLVVIVIVVIVLVRTRMNMKGSFYVSPPGGFENALYSKGDETLAIQS